MKEKDIKTVFYFGLEPIKSRYTEQLSKHWMPATFAPYKTAGELEFIDIPGDFDPDQQIKVGAVLDAVGRGKFAMSQCSNFLDMINNDQVKDGDVIFLQDYWTPGMDAIWYALDLYGIKVKVYAMIHAQSVDEYDFTWPMRNWMRHYELGLDERMTAIFVGSTIHRDQLRQAGFKAPIHVVSLPLHHAMTLAKLPDSNLEKENKVVFSSRLDKEKNPFFMLQVAEIFLENMPNYTWHVTTSGKSFKSMLPGVIEEMNALARRQPRFKLLSNLTKEEYYTELATAKIQFNSSLQDYVSWTVLESTAFGCDVVFPNLRSFPEFIPARQMYQPFQVQDAVNTLMNCIFKLEISSATYNFAEIADIGRRMEAYIIANDYQQEINVWHELEYCKYLLKQQGYNE